MKKINKCNLCGNSNLSFVRKQKDDNFGIKGNFSIYKCDNCKALLTSLKMSGSGLKKYYPNNYYSFGDISLLEKSSKVDSRIFFYNLYYNEEFFSLLSFFKPLFLPFKFLVRGTKIARNLKILDVGCGSGQFLYEMKESGLDVYGIEPFIEIPEDINKIKSNLFKAKYPEENFDLITMNMVLQHVNNPKRMLKEIHRILKKDGLFIVSASNTRSLAHWIFRKNWFQLDIPRHLFNCSDKTLKQFIENCGFKVVKNRHNSRPNQFVVSLYHLFDVKYKNSIMSNFLGMLFLPLTWFVNLIKLGDQVELWCIKDEC